MKRKLLFLSVIILALIFTAIAFYQNDRNEYSIDEKLAAPVLDREAGFYDEAFYLNLSGPDGAKIYYTIDGSDPRCSKTAVFYRKPIRIYDNNNDKDRLTGIMDTSLCTDLIPLESVDKGIVVRAACRSGKTFGNETVQTYFINKTKSYYKDMLVVSLVTDARNLFDEDNGIYMIGNQYYEWKDSEDYNPKLELWKPTNPTNYNQSGRGWERPCSIQVFKDGALDYSSGAGMRIQGAASRQYQQKSITLYARSEYGSKNFNYPFFGETCTDFNGKVLACFDKVTMRNGGNDQCLHFRDDLITAMGKECNLSTMCKADTVLFINGEFWGFYSMQEKMDKHYLHSHFGVEEENVTIVKNQEISGSKAAYDDFCELYRNLMASSLENEEMYNLAESYIDLDSLIDYFALESYVYNLDFAIVLNNCQMWRVNRPQGNNPYCDGKWRFMLYDTEYSMGLYDGKTDAPLNYWENIDKSTENYALPALFMKLMENNSFRQRFCDRYLQLVAEKWTTENVLKSAEAFAERQKEPMRDTWLRFGKENFDENWQNEWDKLETFIRERPEFAISHLCSFSAE